jgi:hypothetical protein
MRLTMVVPDLPPSLNAAMEGLVCVNVTMLIAAMLAGRPVPPLYRSGVRYGREPGKREWWQTVADTMAELERVKKKAKLKSQTDCEDLACHRAGELRVGAVLASLLGLSPNEQQRVLRSIGQIPQQAFQVYPARAVCVRTGPRTYHAIVRHPDGHYEDPSRALGMPAPPLWLSRPYVRP